MSMNERKRKQHNQHNRSKRTRTRVQGTAQRPRLSVKISSAHVSAQIINDENAQTIAAFSTIGAKKTDGTMTEKATQVGAGIAKAAASKKVKKVVFDRGSKKYHGRIKALAEAARNEGLEF